MNAIGIAGVIASLLSMALSVFTILRVRHLSRRRLEIVSDYARLGSAITGGKPLTGGEDVIKPEAVSDRVIRQFSRRLADYEKRCG